MTTPHGQTVAILGTRYPDLAIEEEVLGPLGVRIVSGDGESDEEVLRASAGAAVVVAGSRPRFGAEVLERLEARAIVRAGIGVDSIDLEAARRNGILVANVPDYGSEAVAFHTIALVLAGMRRLVEADRSLRSGSWGVAPLRPLFLPSSRVAGVVGFGRIGRRVSQLLVSLGFRTVLVADPMVEAGGEGIEPVELAELLGRAHVVTLHAPVPADGSPLLGSEELEMLQPGTLLVNTARGALVDSAALAAGMAADRPRVAALDVFPAEPPDLARFEDVLDRMILTPHMAWYTEESQAELRRRSAEEAARILQGEPPRNVVVDPGGIGGPREERGT